MACKTQRMASLCKSCLFVKNAGRVESGMELVVDIEKRHNSTARPPNVFRSFHAFKNISKISDALRSRIFTSALLKH